MAMHMRAAGRLRTVRLSEQPVSQCHVVGNHLVWLLALAILTVGVLLAGWPGPATAPSAALQRAVGESLSQSASDTSERLVRTSMTSWGDLLIEFVLREEGDARANRAAALADALMIVRDVYEGPDPRPSNVTLLGVWRSSLKASTVPLLYASLPADRLVGLDWTRIQRDDLATLGVVRWLPSGICQAWHDCGAGLG